METINIFYGYGRRPSPWLEFISLDNRNNILPSSPFPIMIKIIVNEP